MTMCQEESGVSDGPHSLPRAWEAASFLSDLVFFTWTTSGYYLLSA